MCSSESSLPLTWNSPANVVDKFTSRLQLEFIDYICWRISGRQWLIKVLRGTFFAENYEDSSKSIQYQILETSRKLLEENTHVIGVIIKAIHWWEKQAIALRGHRDDNSNDLANKGNLMAMLSLLAENDKILRKYRLKLC